MVEFQKYHTNQIYKQLFYIQILYEGLFYIVHLVYMYFKKKHFSNNFEASKNTVSVKI